MCLVNLYEPDHYIGSHSDNEKTDFTRLSYI